MLYIDTEKKFSPSRLVELARSRWPEKLADPAMLKALTERVLVIRPATSIEVMQWLKVALSFLETRSARHQALALCWQ